MLSRKTLLIKDNLGPASASSPEDHDYLQIRKEAMKALGIDRLGRWTYHQHLGNDPTN